MERKKILLYVGMTVLFAAVVLAVVLILFLTPSNESLATGPKLVIDHDGGADDAMAIYMALLQEEYFNGPKVIGLTTSHGNVDETQVFENSQRILGIAGRRYVPIYRGSNFSLVLNQPSDFYYGHDGLGDLENVTYEAMKAEPEHAVIALIELSKKYEGDLIVVVIGALTNIALAIKLDPHFISRLSQLYVGAGNIYGPGSTEAEFNALADVESYHIVVRNSKPDKVTVVPFSPIEGTHNISREWREQVLGGIQTKIMQSLNDFERISIVQNKLWWNLDPVVMALALDDSLVTDLGFSDNSIILCGERRGINTNNFTDVADATVKIAFAPDEERYKNLLFKLFSAELLFTSTQLT